MKLVYFIKDLFYKVLKKIKTNRKQSVKHSKNKQTLIKENITEKTKLKLEEQDSDDFSESQTVELNETLETVEADADIKLNETLETAEADADIKLSETPETVEANADIKLNETLETAEADADIKLSETPETVEANADIELSETLETVEADADIKLNETLETAEADDDIELIETPETVEADADIKLNETLETAEADADIKLNETLETAEADADIKLSETPETVEANADIELNETLETAEADADIKLSETPETVEANADIKLNETLETAEADADIKLSETPETVEADADIKLNETLETVEADADIKLNETLETVEANADIELNETLETAEADADIKLSETPETVEANADIKLSETPETVEANADIKLNETLETVEANADIELNETLETAEADADIKLSETPETVEANADIKLSETPETVEANADIKLNETLETVEADADIKLNETLETAEADADIKLIETPETVEADADLELNEIQEITEADSDEIQSSISAEETKPKQREQNLDYLPENIISDFEMDSFYAEKILNNNLPESQIFQQTKEPPEEYFELIPLRPDEAKEENEEKIADDFIKQLENEQIEDIFSLKFRELDYKFTISLSRYDFIGEMPISERVFESLSEHLRKRAEVDGEINPRYSLPTVFAISMVFCARYSNYDSSSFWQPYAEQVWHCEPTQPFQNTCRKLFITSREYLKEVLNMSFDVRKRGDVVRPVYQHAIIPSYLQKEFADWLIKNFDNLMQYPSTQLPEVLRQDNYLDYIPIRLKNFIIGEDTIDTSVRLITRMIDAIRLFNEEGQSTAVEAAFNSTIERSVWKLIYQKLVNSKSKKQLLHKISPKLNWQWDIENNDITLSLSRVILDNSEKPDSIVWTKNNDHDLKNNYIEKIYPWQTSSGDWEIELWTSLELGPLDGDILILSENYDLDVKREEQEKQIVFERKIPKLPNEIMFFRVDHNAEVAELKDAINSNGTWIIASTDNIQIENSSGFINPEQLYLPDSLQKLGYTNMSQYSIELPCVLHMNNQSTKFISPQENIQVDYLILGEEKVKNITKDIPPIFESSEIKLKFSSKFDLITFRKILLAIRHNGEFLNSVYLLDLYRKKELIVSNDFFIIDLTSYVKTPGAYTITVLQDLKPVLDKPIRFSWLPLDIKISEPKENITFSTENPACIKIEGVNPDFVKTYVDEKCKKTINNNIITLQWYVLKNNRCRFDLLYKNYPIHFCWIVDRISAWIEGVGDTAIVSKGQEDSVEINVRGKAREPFQLQIKDSNLKRQSFLDGKGEYKMKLTETTVYDMLKESSQAFPNLSVWIRNISIDLFEYQKEIDIRIDNITYNNKTLKFSLLKNQILEGQYSILVLNAIGQKFYECELTNNLKDNYKIDIDLLKGKYNVEIHLFERLINSASFTVIDDVKINTSSIIKDNSSSQYSFQILTSLEPESFMDNNIDPLIHPVLEQYKTIHDKETWLCNKEYEECFVNLLPSWAVLAHPLKFITKVHQRSLHVFPEKVLYGGKEGRGYVEIKVEEEKIKAVATWRSDGKQGWSRLWLGVPQVTDVDLYNELDPVDLWPAYRCVDCSMILASREGLEIKLPPSVVQQHKHGKNRSIREQFIDTVYKENVEVIIQQYKNIKLEHAYQITDMVTPNYLKSLIDGESQPVEEGFELSSPLILFDSQDYHTAISDLFYHLEKSDFSMIKENLKKLLRIPKYINNNDIVPAFGPAQRLMAEMLEDTYPESIPTIVFSVAMSLRLKAHDPLQFKKMLDDLNLNEAFLIQMTNFFVENCPRLFEWSMALAETFYIHAAS